MFSAFSVPVILNTCILPGVLHIFIGIIICTSHIHTMIFIALENMHPLQNFDFL